MKNLVTGAVVVACLGATVAVWSMTPPKPVGVSKIKNNPGQHVGKLVMVGVAGRTDADYGLLEVADEKACCTVVLEVPVTAEQQAKLKSAERFTGELPAAGTPLEVRATLRDEGGKYTIDVSRVSSGGKVIIKRL